MLALYVKPYPLVIHLYPIEQWLGVRDITQSCRFLSTGFQNKHEPRSLFYNFDKKIIFLITNVNVCDLDLKTHIHPNVRMV